MLAPLPPAPARALARTGPALLTHSVPADLASAFRSVHGVDVSDVPVHRGHVVSDHARVLGARAFTRDREVYLPDPAGPLDQAPARALLAHELTHAAQQRMLGAALPAESSADGQLLEAQATATERWFLGSQEALPPLTHFPAGLRVDGLAADGRPRQDHTRLALRSLTGGQGVQRLPAESATAAALTPADAQAGSWSAPEWLGVNAAGAAGNGVPEPPSATAASATAGMISDTRGELAEMRERLTDLAGQRHVGLDDPSALDELAARLYQRLRSKLRLELIVDRERAGLLSDFR